MPLSQTATQKPAIKLDCISIDDSLWTTRRQTLAKVTLLSQWHKLHESGRLAALGIWNCDAEEPEKHGFWDSDNAKWLEAVAYTQTWHQDQDIYQKAKDVIQGYEDIQWDDGFIGQVYNKDEPEKRFIKLQGSHEFYTAGHLIEAAVAWKEQLGDDQLLKCVVKFAELLWTRFGEDGVPAYDGHPEIELALNRLAHCTGDDRWRRFSHILIERRGQEPNYFAAERKKCGDDRPLYPHNRHENLQADKPIHQHDHITGHSVRALYLLAGMQDLAPDDAKMAETCDRLWNNTVDQRMYVTGGFGSHHAGEEFTDNYDLPNRNAYSETCASIAGAFVAQRRLQQKAHGSDADILERCLYNTCLSGIGIDGESYFYANPLCAQPGHDLQNNGWNHAKDCNKLKRFPWHHCSCCPPNIARLLGSLGQYIYRIDADALSVNLYIGSEIENQGWKLEQNGNYAWQGQVSLRIHQAPDTTQEIRLRLPAWSQNTSIKINGEDAQYTVVNNYAVLSRDWQENDHIEMQCDMQAQTVFSDPRCDDNVNRIAVQRGPFIYCMENCDHTEDIRQLRLKTDCSFNDEPFELLEGAIALRTQGHILRSKALYSFDKPQAEDVDIRLVPYHLWANRELGAMQVWIGHS
ncbi:MAG: glycoside hydrolase family 127 protein [Planctomycetes bacterium]|nr:glycoside hydrolase family 127 protein [Planctomycetota bacterium]